MKVQITENDKVIWGYEKTDTGCKGYTGMSYISNGTMNKIKETLENTLKWVNGQIVANDIKSTVFDKVD